MKTQKLTLTQNKAKTIIASDNIALKICKKLKKSNYSLSGVKSPYCLHTNHGDSMMHVNLESPAIDEHSIFSVSTMNVSIDLEQISVKEKISLDHQINKTPSGKTHSITPSASISKTSHDETLSSSGTFFMSKLFIMNEIYPSIEYEYMNGIPLVFLGAEKILRTRMDWTKVKYPLSSYYIEIMLDLLSQRPSFIREIPRVTKLNIYRPLIKTVSGLLFFDDGKNRASVHQCGRLQINRKFNIDDLASIHQREFHIINYNAIYEDRFVNLYENLFEIYHYEGKSTS